MDTPSYLPTLWQQRFITTTSNYDIEQDPEQASSISQPKSIRYILILLFNLLASIITSRCTSIFLPSNSLRSFRSPLRATYPTHRNLTELDKSQSFSLYNTPILYIFVSKYLCYGHKKLQHWRQFLGAAVSVHIIVLTVSGLCVPQGRIRRPAMHAVLRMSPGPVVGLPDNKQHSSPCVQR
jgi:hypothetical protein